MPLLQDDDEVTRIIGIARRPFDPAERGWTKMEYRRGDVRDVEALREAFAGADVVVHLAFLIISGGKETTQAINVEGTLNAFRAAAEAGARRFVYASSIAAYGFHRDNPIGITEDWPTRPADRLFYSQEKAELEHLLHEEAARHPETDLYLLRPPIVLGPDAVGAKAQLPPALVQVLQRRAQWDPPSPCRSRGRPRPAHAADPPGRRGRGAAPVRGRGRPARRLQHRRRRRRERGRRRPRARLPAARGPGQPVAAVARAITALPFLPSGAQWVEVMGHPAIMDTTKARTELGWSPKHSAIESLRATLPQEPEDAT